MVGRSAHPNRAPSSTEGSTCRRPPIFHLRTERACRMVVAPCVLVTARSGRAAPSTRNVVPREASVQPLRRGSRGSSARRRYDESSVTFPWNRSLDQASPSMDQHSLTAESGRTARTVSVVVLVSSAMRKRTRPHGRVRTPCLNTDLVITATLQSVLKQHAAEVTGPASTAARRPSSSSGVDGPYWRVCHSSGSSVEGLLPARLHAGRLPCGVGRETGVSVFGFGSAE